MNPIIRTQSLELKEKIKQDASCYASFRKEEKTRARGSIAICTKVNKWARLYSRRLLKEYLLFLFRVYLRGDFSTAGVAGNWMRATPSEQEGRWTRLQKHEQFTGLWALSKLFHPNYSTFFYRLILRPLTVWEEVEHEVWIFRARRRWRKKSGTSRTLHWERFPWSVHPGSVGKGHTDGWDTADHSKKMNKFCEHQFHQMGRACTKKSFFLA